VPQLPHLGNATKLEPIAFGLTTESLTEPPSLWDQSLQQIMKTRPMIHLTQMTNLMGDHIVDQCFVAEQEPDIETKSGATGATAPTPTLVGDRDRGQG
jgi:hypothetical protein